MSDDNAQHDICCRTLVIERKTYTSLNNWLAQIIASLTAPLLCEQARVWSCHTISHSRANAAQALSSKNIEVRLPSSSSDNIGGSPPPVSKIGIRRARFNSELNEACSVTPCSQVYGVHPLMVFKKGMRLPFPPPFGGRSHMSSKCGINNQPSTVLHVTSVTGEKVDLWYTGWSSRPDESHISPREGGIGS